MTLPDIHDQTVRLSGRLKEALARCAELEEVSESHIVRQALKAYLAAKEQA